MRCFARIIYLLFNILSLTVFVYSQTSHRHCSRAASRLVRKVLDKYVYLVIESHGVNMSLDCPLRRSRDLYYYQEQQKNFEHHAKWSCEVCGKSFYKQEFIDKHMEHKHNDLLVKKEDSPVCLADYCQLFRCEAIENSRSSNHFWSKALCNQENMKNLKKKCLSLVQSCMPNMETSSALKQAYDEIIGETCSLINCKDYWQTLHYELTSLEILYYIVISPIVISVLSIYYYNVWEHYYGDDAEETNHTTTDNRKSSANEREAPEGLRNRFTSSRFDY